MHTLSLVLSTDTTCLLLAFYNFPKIFQAKLNKNEWNIYKYSGKIDLVEQIISVTTCCTTKLQIL